MVGIGAIHGPGLRCVVYDIAEVAAQARGVNAPSEYQGVPSVVLRSEPY